MKITRCLILNFALGFLINNAFAQPEDIYGTFTPTESGDTYYVWMQNNDGHVYNGYAVELEDGTGDMRVNIGDGEGEAYNGIASPDEVGDYDLKLQNIRSGTIITGEADKYD